MKSSKLKGFYHKNTPKKQAQVIHSLTASITNLFGFKQIEAHSSVDPTLICEKINKELEEQLLEKSINTDSTDGVFDFVETLSNQVQENFDELIERTLTKNGLSEL